jgi:hypothetical protein
MTQDWCPKWDHSHQGPSAAELSDSYVRSVESPGNLREISDGDNPRRTSRKNFDRDQSNDSKKWRRTRKWHPPPSSPRNTFSISEKQGRDNLHAEGRKTDKSYIVPIDTGASGTIARPDITVGLPERDLTTPQVKICVWSLVSYF